MRRTRFASPVLGLSYNLCLAEVLHRTLLAEAVCAGFDHQLPALSSSLEAASVQLCSADCSHICDFLRLPRPVAARSQVLPLVLSIKAMQDSEQTKLFLALSTKPDVFMFSQVH